MPKKIVTLIRRLVIPHNMAGAGWDFEEERILDFMDAFGIKKPVKIRYTSGRYTVGCHRAKYDANGNWYHSITMSQIRPMAESNVTLLHELRHAIQCESHGSPEKFHKEYSKHSSGYSKRYLSNPFEVDAREFAAKNAEKWSLLY